MRQAGLPAVGRTGARAAAQLHLPLPQTGDVYPAKDDPGNVYRNPDLAAEFAAEFAAEAVEQGFTAVKFDPAGPYTVYDGHQPSLEDIERSVTFVRQIREAVGTRADLLFGTHGQFTTSGAIRLARQLEPYDPLWFEEPTPPENPREMGRVACQTTISIATGERLATKYEFARVLENQAASILQPALGRVGGILEGKKIAGLAETYYAQIAPHLYCGPIEAAANIPLATCSPNFLILESIQQMGGFHAELLKKPLTWQDGFIIPPTDPGIGVELNEAVAEAHPWDGDELHLTMVEDPVR